VLSRLHGFIDPGDLVDVDGCDLEVSAMANDHGGSTWLQVNDIAPLAKRNPYPPALADREPNDTIVLTKDIAVGVDDATSPVSFGALAAEEVLVAISTDEANVLTIGFGGGAETELCCDRPGLVLGELSDRQPDPGQFSLGEHREDVGLILAPVSATVKLEATSDGNDPGVVTRHEEVAAEFTSLLEQPGELDRAVALHTGIGSPTT
jgi:hypothetical protein